MLTRHTVITRRAKARSKKLLLGFLMVMPLALPQISTFPPTGGSSGTSTNAGATVNYTPGSTIAFNGNSSTLDTSIFFVPTASLTANATSTTCGATTAFTHGSVATFEFTQDSTGGRTVATCAGWDAFSIDLSANITTILTYSIDGSGNGHLVNSSNNTLVSVQTSTTDTLVCSTIGANTEAWFATTYTVPANVLIAGKTFRFTVGVSGTGSSSPSSITTTVRWGGTGGTLLYTGNSFILPTSLTESSGGSFFITGTAAASASANVFYTPIGASPSTGSIIVYGAANTLAQPVAVATNASKAIAFGLKCNNNTAGNSVTLNTLTVEILN